MRCHFTAAFPAFTVEFADGGDLAAKLEEQRADKKTFPEEAVVDWVGQLLLALTYAHERKILHRDL